MPRNPPRTAASMYSSSACGLVTSRPAWARSNICWPTSVSASVAMPLRAALSISLPTPTLPSLAAPSRRSSPAAFSPMFLNPGKTLMALKTSISAALWNMAADAAFIVSICSGSVILFSWTWRSTFIPKNDGIPANVPPMIAPAAVPKGTVTGAKTPPAVPARAPTLAPA